MTDFALARRNMVDGQLRPNRVTNAQLLAAIGDLPRERFLPAGLQSVAYADDDVPLGNGRFLMEPMVLARLIQTLQPLPEDKALVVASGAGYGAALLARLVKTVVAVEATPAWPVRPSRPSGIWASPTCSRSSARWKRAAPPRPLRRDPDRRRGAESTAGDPRPAGRGRPAGHRHCCARRRAGRGATHGEGRRRRVGPSAVRRRDAALPGFAPPPRFTF